MIRSHTSTTARLTRVTTVTDKPPADRRLLWSPVVIALLSGLFLAIFFGGQHLVAHLLAAHWRQALETVSDDQAEKLLASAARLGRPGLPVLVDALGSPRTAVSEAGMNALKQELRSWENLSGHEGQRNVEALAESLSGRIDSFDAEARVDAALLAQRMLRWHLDRDTVNRPRVTWQCEKILRAAQFRQQATSETVLAAVDTTSELLPGEGEALGTDATSEQEIAALPRETHMPEQTAVDPGLIIPPAALPLPEVSAALPKSGANGAWTMQGQSLTARRLPEGPAEAPIYPKTGMSAAAPGSATTDKTAELELPATEEWSLTDCLHRLHGPGLEKLLAESELKRRDFDPLQMAIAKRIYHPEVEARLELVRQLPDIPGVGATNWLLRMAEDESEEVRLAAITLLATGTDPQLLDHVESIARQDSSERIRNQAALLARGRDRRRR